MNLSRSTFYDTPAIKAYDAEILARITAICDEFEAYGYRRVGAELRVTHLIAAGADPGRVLLLTFSRQAAAEMTRRVERIVAEGLGLSHPAARSGITWAGTFHGVGARLLRLYGSSIGLPPGFTISPPEQVPDEPATDRSGKRLVAAAPR
jgi:UvrD/REP helicase N-terminal domain